MANSGKFTPEALDSKLRDLNSTLQSIQGVSQWLMNHKKYAKTIVGVWFREMQKGCYIDGRPKAGHTLGNIVASVAQKFKATCCPKR